MPGLVTLTGTLGSLSTIRLPSGGLVTISPNSLPSLVSYNSSTRINNNETPDGELRVETSDNISGLSSFPEALATIQVSKGVNDFPTASASFYKSSDDLNDSLSRLEIGNNYNLFGIPFVLDSYTVTTYLQSAQRICQVNLNFVSKHAPRGNLSPLNPLDKPVQFDPDTTSIDWGDISSKISTPVSMGSSRYAKYYGGQSVVELTPRSEMEAAFLLSANHLIVYSKETIFGKSLESFSVGTMWYKDFLEDTIEFTVTEYPFYRDAELTLEEIPVPSKLEVSQRLEFENATDLSNVVTPSNSPGDVELLNQDMRNPGAVFDNGGRTKTMRRIWEKDGQPIQIEERVYGYVFNMKEMITMPEQPMDYVNANFKWPITFKPFVGNLARLKWRVVQYTLTDYHYDNDGYLMGTTKNGWKLARLNRETGDYETVSLVLKMYKNYYRASTRKTTGEEFTNTPLAWKADAREYNSYTFFNPVNVSGEAPVFEELGVFGTQSLHQYPIVEKTNYYLDDLTKYYADIQEDTVSVPPKFVYRSYSHTRNQEVVPNPKDDPNDPNAPYAPLLIFKEQKELTTTQVVIPKSIDASQKTPEMFVVNTYNHSTEGPFSDQSLMIGNSTQSLGRPSVHTRLNTSSSSDYPSDADRIARNRYIVSGSIGGNSIPTTNVIPRISIGTSGSRSFVPTSTISFNGAATPEAGRVGAKNTLEREFLNSQRIVVHVPFNQFHRQLEEGDIWQLEDDLGNKNKWVIMSISYSLELVADSRYICKDGIELSLSPAKTASVSVSSRPRSGS